MSTEHIKKWFAARDYTLGFNQIEPVYRRSRVYAVASPNVSGGWLSFHNREAVIEYIDEQNRLHAN